MFPRTSDTRVDGPCQGSEQVCFSSTGDMRLDGPQYVPLNSRFEVPVVLQSFALSPCKIQKLLQVRFCLRPTFPVFTKQKDSDCQSIVWAFVNFLNPDRAEKIPKMFSFSTPSCPRCQRGHRSATPEARAQYYAEQGMPCYA